MAIRVLIADTLAPAGAAVLRSRPGTDVTIRTDLTGSDLAAALAGHDGAVVRSTTRITGPVLEETFANAHARLKAIARAGVGVDNIDVETATRFGVAVMNSASASTITTAEHAFALLIALARKITGAHVTMAAGGWDRNQFMGMQLHGHTLGIVGFGRIGQTLAQRALAFGMNVIAYDPLYNAETALEGAVRLVKSFDDLLPTVDFLSFHVPKTESTTGMLNRDRLEKLKPGALVINAARGGIIDEAALIEAIDAGQCGGAALDVFETEPPPKDSPLRNHPKILLTPHLGASTVEAQEAVAIDACKAVLKYLTGEGLEGAVNAAGLQMDLTDRQRAFVALASRMIALVQAVASEPNLRAVHVTVRGEALARRADTIARYALAELLKSSLDQPVNVINSALIAEQRHIETETIIAADTGEERLSIEISTQRGSHRVDGAMYEDGLPRITFLDGYHMDMVPAGQMVILTNADRPGRIGLVGKLFGDAEINIAEMVISRKCDSGGSGPVAMMILKLDNPPPAELLETLRQAEGILSVAAVTLSGL